MGNPNPFYRFKQGWNAGFYPDNQIVSDLLNEIHTNITALLPSWAVVGTTLAPQLVAQVKAYIDGYNSSPYFGNFIVTAEYQYSSPTDFRITIIDSSLYVIDNSQYIEITGEFVSMANKVLTIAPVLNAFAPGSYTGTFDPTLINEELKIKEALEIVDINGSAIFPITYSYDATTGVATSGLARGKDWQLVQGAITRLPAPTLPLQNQRTFQLPALNGDDLYIVSIMERIIQASLADGDYTTSVLATFNSFTMPDGWTASVNYPSYTTYERVQFDFENPLRRKFNLVGRKDGGWLWQRFVSDEIFYSPCDFLFLYTETTPMPYQVNQAGRWIYPLYTYDFEFVEFTSDCYVSPEFYAMPAKPGDQLQFNVIDGNITGLTSVDVGLFTESGQFVQKIGETTLLPTPGCECVDCAFRMEINFNEAAFANYLDQLNEILIANPDNNIFFFKYEYLIDGVDQGNYNEGHPFDPGFEFNTTNIFDYCQFDGFQLELIDGLYRFSLDVPNAECGKTYQFKQYFMARVNQGEAGYQIMWDADVYECPTPEPTYILEQHQATVTIPSKQGCYRMGLYEIIEGTAPQTDCNLSIVYYLTNDYPNFDFSNNYTGFLEAIDIIGLSANPYITFEIDGQKYVYQTPGGISPNLSGVCAWASANIPGMIAQDYEDTTRAFFKWEGTVSCGETGYTIQTYQSDEGGNQVGEILWATEPKYCNCEPHCSKLYKQYYGPGISCNSGLYSYVFNNPTQYVALVIRNQTFSSYNVINKKPCSSFQSQDEFISWLMSIPGFYVTKTIINGSCLYTYTYHADIPCDGNEYVPTLDIVDINDNYILTGSNISNGFVSCECNSTCEATFTYTISENGGQWFTDLKNADIPFYSIYIESGGNISNQYIFEINQTTFIDDAVFYFNSIPGMTCTYDGSNVMTWTWTTQIPCDSEVVLRLAGLGITLYPEDVIWTTDAQTCSCPIVPEPGQFYSALYSLSNIINIDKSDCFSTILEFWSDNSTMAEGFEYYNNWKQRVRIGINGGGEKPIIEESLYRQSNGVHRRPQNKQDLSLDLHTDFFDLETQLAMTDATRHPYLVWEGKPIFVKGDIEVATTQDFTTQSSFETLSQMKFQALLQGFQPRNSSCINC